MSLQRRFGLGVQLLADIAGGTNYVTLGAVVNAIKHGGTKADTADMSILTDTFKQFAKGQIDPGEWDFEIAFDPGDNAANQANTNARLVTMHAATGVNGYPFQLSLPAILSPGTNTAQLVNFSAHVTSKGITSEKDKLLVCPVKLKVTGDPGF